MLNFLHPVKVRNSAGKIWFITEFGYLHVIFNLEQHSNDRLLRETATT